MTAITLAAGDLRHRIRIERPIAGDEADSAGSGEWGTVCIVAAHVQDILPSRSERLNDGLNMAARPARVRIRYRSDITADMRMLIGGYRSGPGGEPEWRTERVGQIIAGPAELGVRAGLEFMVEDYSTAGNPA